MKYKIINSLICYIYDHEEFDIDYYQTHGAYTIKRSLLYQIINNYRYHRGIRKLDKLNNIHKLLISNLKKMNINICEGL